MFTVVVTASRFWQDNAALSNLLVSIQDNLKESKAHKDFRLIHGDCPRGGDRMAGRIAMVLGWEVIAVPAEWDHCGVMCPPPMGHRKIKRIDDVDHPGELPDYCPAAGPRRNQKMINMKPDLVVALFATHKRSLGTMNCVKLAEREGIRVIRLRSEYC